MTIDSGALRHRVVIEYPQHSQDSITGAMTPQWLELDEVWAAIEPLSARDFTAAQAQQSKIVARIVVRWRDDITADMRISHGSTVYAIEGILPDKESGREYLTILVSSGVKQS